MINSYVKTEWVNGQAPALNAANLNKIEQGIYDITEEVKNINVEEMVTDEVSENMGNYMLLPGSAPDDGNLWRQGQIGFVGGKPVIKTSSVGSFNYAVLATEAYVDTVLNAIADALAAI